MRIRRENHRLLTLFLVASWVAAATHAGDWPGWRGPSRDGSAAAFRVPDSWPEQLEQRWKISVGIGHSAPAVAGGRAFVVSREDDNEVVRAVDLDGGDVSWEQRYPVAYKAAMGSGRYGRGPRSSPVHSDGRLFTLSVTGMLTAWDADTGQRLWREEFTGRFKKTRPHFGAAASPLVDGRRVVSLFGGSKDGAAIAFDVATGEQVWSTPSDGASYASAIITQLDGIRQVVTISSEAVVGFDAESGEATWSFPFSESMARQNIVTPLSYDGLVVVSGEGRGITALRPRLSADEWSVEKAWNVETLAMEMSSPVKQDGRIFGLSHRDKGRIYCVDAATGKILWTSSPRTAGHASLLAMDGTILVLTEAAELLVLGAGGDAYDERARYTVADTPTWAHLVPVDDGVLVKDREHLTLWSWKP